MLVFMLANFSDQNERFKSQISYPCKCRLDEKQGRLDTKRNQFFPKASSASHPDEMEKQENPRASSTPRMDASLQKFQVCNGFPSSTPAPFGRPCENASFGRVLLAPSRQPLSSSENCVLVSILILIYARCRV